MLMNPTQFPPRPGRAPLMLLDCLHIDLPALNGPTAPNPGFPEAWVSDERDERALPLLQCVAILGTNRNSIEEMQRMHGTRRLLISESDRLHTAVTMRREPLLRRWYLSS